MHDIKSIGESMAIIGEYMDQFGYDCVNQLSSEDLDILSESLGVRMADVARLLNLRDFE